MSVLLLNEYFELKTMKYSENLQRKREIRMRIGRMRRQINNHLHATSRAGRRLLSWREYVIRYPSYAILSAFGVGLAASRGFRLGHGDLLRKMGLRVARQTMEHAGQHLWQEIQRIWSQSGAKP
jgi:hypothetical protein